MSIEEFEPDKIFKCLTDLGICKETVDSIITLWQDGHESEALALLTTFRKDVLGEMHVCQKRIDCLDYLLYKAKEHIEE